MAKPNHTQAKQISCRNYPVIIFKAMMDGRIKEDA